MSPSGSFVHVNACRPWLTHQLEDRTVTNPLAIDIESNHRRNFALTRHGAIRPTPNTPRKLVRPRSENLASGTGLPQALGAGTYQQWPDSGVKSSAQIGRAKTGYTVGSQRQKQSGNLVALRSHPGCSNRIETSWSTTQSGPCARTVQPYHHNVGTQASLETPLVTKASFAAWGRPAHYEHNTEATIDITRSTQPAEIGVNRGCQRC